MNDFKSEKARQLFIASLKIDEAAKAIRNGERNEPIYISAIYGSPQLNTEAANLRQLANKIEKEENEKENKEKSKEDNDLEI